MVERLHRTVEDLLQRCLVTLDAKHWPTLIPDLQLTINTAYARSIGCPPYLIMYGTSPPSLYHAHLPDPTIASSTAYASAVRDQMRTIQRASTAAHAAYRHRE